MKKSRFSKTQDSRQCKFRAAAGLRFHRTLRYAAEMNRLLEKLRKHLPKQGQDSVGASLARMQHPVFKRMARGGLRAIPRRQEMKKPLREGLLTLSH